MKVNCAYCNTELERQLWQIKNCKNSFCNMTCHGKWKSENLIGDNHPTYKKIEVQCKQCGKKVEKSPSHIKRSKNIFCNSKCYSKWLTGKKLFTGHRIKVSCEGCGKELEKAKWEIKLRKLHFCGNKCRGEWRSKNIIGKNSPSWKGGISAEPYCPVWLDRDFKEDIKIRDGHKCQNPNCWKNIDNLNIHHIDYDKKNCHPNNLITLCRSCNSRANKDRYWHTAYYNAIMKKNNKLLGAVA